MRQDIIAPSTLSTVGTDRLLAQINRVSGSAESLVLDLSRVRKIQMGAGWELGNALRPFSGRVDVKVSTEAAVLTGSSHFLSFTRSGLGLAIARHARRIASTKSSIGGRGTLCDLGDLSFAAPESASGSHLGAVPPGLAGDL